MQSVLFMCAMNAVRSPMAEALAKHFFGKSIYVQSAGARKGEADGFVLTVLDEIGIDLSRHKPKSVEELEEWEGLNFDLIITLSPEAHHKALDLTRTHAAEVEYWPTSDPVGVEGRREQLARLEVDLANCIVQRVDRVLQVGHLGVEEDLALA